MKNQGPRMESRASSMYKTLQQEEFGLFRGGPLSAYSAPGHQLGLFPAANKAPYLLQWINT